jgi:hypothetical protein
MEEMYLSKKEIRVPSTVAGEPPVATTYAAGGDHAAFELGLRLFYQEAQHACQTAAENVELVAVYGNVAMLANDWTLAGVVADALSSGSNTVKRVFGERCKLFIDWWHRRSSFKTELSKMEVCGGCVCVLLISFLT